MVASALIMGGKLRATAATGVHDQSSRSHARLGSCFRYCTCSTRVEVYDCIASLPNPPKIYKPHLQKPNIVHEIHEIISNHLNSIFPRNYSNNFPWKIHPRGKISPAATPSLCRIFVESGEVEGCITLVDLAGSEHRIVPWWRRRTFVGRWVGGGMRWWDDGD